MRTGLLWRRSATAAGLYASVALGILGTVVAARVLGLDEFGLFATALAVASFFQILLDLTVEEALTKYGFRYVAAGDWGRLRRLFTVALRIKLAGGLLATIVLALFAPFADAVFSTEGLTTAMFAVALLPLVQSPENVAASALLLRGRYDLRGAYQTLGQGLRLVGILVGAQFGVAEALLGIVIGQAIATVVVSVVGHAAFQRFPRAPEVPLDDDRSDLVSFVVQSSIATGMVSARTTLAPIVLGIVAGPSQVGLLRIAQAPQSGFAAASSPVRLILLTEQTRDWEHGKRTEVLRGVRQYMVSAAGVVVVAVPVFWIAMPWLVRVVFGEQYLGAVSAARIVLLAAAIQLVLGWTKSFATTVGRPRLRIVSHGVETLVLLPLTAVFGAAWGVTGAAGAILAASVAYALVWVVLLARIRAEVSAASTGTREALAP